MGNLTKIFVHFDVPFWPRDRYVFGCYSGAVADRPTVIINVWKPHKLPVLTMLVGGDKGREIEQWSEEDTRAWAIAVLQDVFGEPIPAPLKVERTQWDQDSFARGAYSYMAVGATPADVEALEEPTDHRLFFAGEATYRHHREATQGAYVSGLREAARIAYDPSILPPRHFTENRRWRDLMHRASRFFNVLSTSISGNVLVERVAVLSDSAVFADIPPSELSVLAMMFERVTFAAGEVIYAVGDPATDMFVIADGEVRVELGNHRALRILRRGDVAGEYGMFGPGLRTAMLVARSDCHVLTLDYQRFRRFLLAFPESALVLFKLTVDQLLEARAEEASLNDHVRTFVDDGSV